MTAANVYWEKAAAGSTTTSTDAGKKNDSGAVDTWKDAPQQDRATAVAPPPAKPDADDPGPPTLQRGKVADANREHASDVQPAPVPNSQTPQTPQTPAAPVETAGNRLPPARPQSMDSIPNSDDDLSVSRPNGDDLIRKATDAAFDFTQNLPNYVCLELINRYQSDSKPANWQAVDRIQTNVVYENGKEDYRNLMVNGRAVNKTMEQMDGAWSTGEFGTMLLNLFSPATAADFRYSHMSRSSGIGSRVYDFTVDHQHSRWDVKMASQEYSPAFRGSVWIDPQTARVLRIEMEAFGFPTTFPTDHVESATDYEYVRLGDAQQYLLPVHSETLSCERGTPLCSRNVIDFRNYHKYSGESTVTFGDPKNPK